MHQFNHFYLDWLLGNGWLAEERNFWFHNLVQLIQRCGSLTKCLVWLPGTAYALTEVRKYLIPDSNDEIRQEQMREMEMIRKIFTSAVTRIYEYFINS